VALIRIAPAYRGRALPHFGRCSAAHPGLSARRLHSGPLGKTKRVTGQGIEDASNQLSGYTIVRAASHEAAAKLFEKHPHFTNFPGECIEIMPVLPIPGA
jgi:hypothetical protein